MKFFLVYLVLINLAAVWITVLDKRRAQRRGRRIPGRTLLLLSVLGGSPGMYLTMRKIRHKTLHRKFMIGIPCIFAAQLLIALAIWYFLPQMGGVLF